MLIAGRRCCPPAGFVFIKIAANPAILLQPRRFGHGLVANIHNVLAAGRKGTAASQIGQVGDFAFDIEQFSHQVEDAQANRDVEHGYWFIDQNHIRFNGQSAGNVGKFFHQLFIAKRGLDRAHRAAVNPQRGAGDVTGGRGQQKGAG